MSLTLQHLTPEEVAAERNAAFDEAIARVQAGADYLTGPFFLAKLTQSVRQAIVQTNSPWLNRDDGKEYARCSISEFDRAVREGFFPTHHRGSSPMFLKTDIDEAIRSGAWKPAKGK